MTHIIANQTREVAISSGYFNHPVQSGVDRAGDWYIYIPANVGNTSLGGYIKPYRWGSALSLANAVTNLQIEGTFALLNEVVDTVNTTYHGGSIEYIGAGVNDITNAVEDDAFFFNHLGSLSPATDDDAFYWDRAYLPDNSTDWDYYQYHKHIPSFYQMYENGRIVVGANGFINPEDKSYGSLIHTRVKVSNVNYQSVLARVHTPSVGGAHNSHNDITLPSVSNKNYMMGGIMKGSGNRFHAFYLTADGSQWRVYNRTYVAANSSFTIEVDLGLFDLADPTLTPGTGSGECYNYPLRVSMGDLLGTKIYFPVILNNATSGFDLEIWSFNSLDTIAGGSLQRTVLISGTPKRPDAQVITVGQNLFVAATDPTDGGVSLFIYENNAWEEAASQIITNGSANTLRVHGFRYNTEDVKFYLLLSGTSTGTGTYVGPGMYTFNLQGDFAGYKHIDYDSTTNSFINRGPLSAGHLIHDNSTGVLTRSSSAEPEGVGSNVRIISYDVPKPVFYNQSVLDLGGDEFIYNGITLDNNKKLLVGRIQGLPYRTVGSDLLLSLVDQDNITSNHFAFGGINPNIAGDDYITKAVQSTVDPNKVWLTGYTKSEMVPKKDMYIHGFCRATVDAPNFLSWDDIVIDDEGDIYLVGTNLDGYMNIAKYTSNYENVWQKQLGFSSNITGNSIAIDSNDNIYVSGNTADGSVVVAKLDSDGILLWSNLYAKTSNTESTNSICIVTKSSIQYVVSAINTDTSTTFVVLNTSGAIVEQKVVANLTVNRIRDHVSTNDGKFLFAGKTSTNGLFGCYEILSGQPILWISQFLTEAFDIVNVDAGPTYGYAICGTSSTNGFVLKVTATESVGTWTVSKSWARQLATAQFYGITATNYSEATRSIYVVGKTSSGGYPLMGMDEGLIAAYSSTGSVLWQNVFGHDMDEQFNSIIMDITGRNVIIAGWSQSHSVSQDAILFRCETGGYGTGVYHLNGNSGMPYYYVKTSLVDSSIATAVTNLSVPSTTTGTIISNSDEFALDNLGADIRIFDGAYGANGTFMLYFGYMDLKKIQEYQNSEEYRLTVKAGRKVHYPDGVFTFWQISTVGDGFADDGNVFGYDLIEASDGTIYVIGQTSGDLTMTNLGQSGAYDYVLVRFDPTTSELEMYQNGTVVDEETYALCELSDGRIAFTGRTTGNLGNTNLGGYDIFLGIYNPTNDVINYYSTGSGLDDKGVGIHDLGNNTLAVVYSSYGGLGDQVNTGSEDIGVILFNYSTNTWGSAYQTGTAGSDIFNQNGKPSVNLGDGRIAIAFSTANIFDTVSSNQGFLDIALAILDINTGTWSKSQVGSQSSEISTSLTAKGERLLLSGYINDTFAKEGQAIYVETDISYGLCGKSSAQ